MSKYKRLLSNTAILGAGTFTSKLLVFLMMPFYTAVLSTTEFGVADLLSQTANLIIPLASVGICDGLFRFTLDAEEKDRKKIFSVAFTVLLIGAAVSLLLLQILRFFDTLGGYIGLIAAYVLAANLHSLCANYIRAQGKTGAFALQGIANTVLTVLFNLLFLLVFDMGTTGYVLSVVMADFTVTLVLFFGMRLYRDLSFRTFDRDAAKEMLKFSIPYIPTSIMWLITSVSDRYIVTAWCGADVNGLYAAAYKLPTLISLASTVFMEAWQFSTVKDALPEERKGFFGAVFENYMSVMFMGASVLIAGSQILTKLLLSDSFYSSWKYIPVLTVALVFSSLSAFFGSVYFLEKKSLMTMITAMAGALVNVVLNFVLIPSHGAMGAAVATFISYLAAYAIRAYDTRRYLAFPMHHLRVAVNTVALLFQAFVMIEGIRYWKYIQIMILLFLLIFNGKGIVLTVGNLCRGFFDKKFKNKKN